MNNVVQQNNQEAFVKHSSVISSDKLLEQFLKHTDMPIYWKNEKLEYAGCNQAFAELANLRHCQDIVGMQELDMPWIYTEFDALKASKEDQEALLGNGKHLKKLQLLHKQDGQPLWLSVSKTVLRDNDGNALGIMGIMQDVTALKIAQNALKENQEKLELLSLSDGLTGLANRKYFDTYLDREVRRSFRDKQDLAVIILNIEHFDIFVETFGQDAADAYLQSVAKACQRCLRRPADFLARYGDTKFAVVLPNTNQDGAKYVATNIIEELEKLELSPEDDEPLSASMSLGVASKSSELELSAGELLQRAIHMLDSAKNLGRNRLGVY